MMELYSSQTRLRVASPTEDSGSMMSLGTPRALSASCTASAALWWPSPVLQLRISSFMVGNPP